MPANSAAWLSTKQTLLKVDSAPYPSARENEIVVKNHAVAINPIDWIKQDVGDFLFSWMKCPFILGSDLAGEVVEVGPGVSRFRVGDRVLAQAVGMDESRNSAAEGAFQTYTVVCSHMASPIPESLSYERAAVLPLGLSTAACGLFQKDHLALRQPSATPTPTGEALLIWGGSTSVGSNAVQLAVAAGYEVVSTASPKNFDYVKSLGASRVFDYNAETVVKDVIEVLRGKTIAGALAIGPGSAEACSEVVHACKGRKFVSMASFPIPFDRLPPRTGMSLRLVGLILATMPFSGSLMLKNRLRGIGSKYIFGTTLMDNEVGPMIYEDFLPKALADGRYVAAPDPYVVGKGLDHIQGGFDLQRKGVSAKKVVVSL